MRVAVIGCGSIGRRHLENLLSLGVRDILIHDRDPETLWRSGIDPCIRACPELNALWDKQPDAVLICTPPWLHIEQAKQAVEHNCHVFIEKPLCHSLQDARALAEMAESTDLIDMVACNWRYHEGPARLRQALNLGFPHNPRALTLWHYSYLPDWVKGRGWREHYSASNEYGGILFEVGWHLVDLALWLHGSARVEEFCLEPSTPLGLKCDGYIGLTLRHRSRQKTIIEADWRYRKRGAAVIVEGDRAEKIGWCLADSKRRGYDDKEMYKAEMRDFLQCCQECRPSPNPVSQAVKVLEILAKAKEMAG